MKRHLRPLAALILKDAKLFAVDRQAIVMAVIIPVLIATILGWLDSSAADETAQPKTAVLFVDLDRSEISRSLQAVLAHNDKITLATAELGHATSAVQNGLTPVAIVIPRGFANDAIAAVSGGNKAQITILSDPSDPIPAQIAEEVVYEHASRLAAKQIYGALADRDPPVAVNNKPVTAGTAKWAKSAHDYSGFGLQGLLFFAVESGVLLSKERRSGVWSRLKSSPVTRELILFSRALSSTGLALAIVLLMFSVGALLFGIRVRGSYLGFGALAVSSAIMAATFGLMISTVGRTETQSRALSILVIFVMLATGGAWFPLSKMPAAVQTFAGFLPVKWAVDGFDGTTWRGVALAETLKTSGVLLAFAALFTAGSLFRFARFRLD